MQPDSLAPLPLLRLCCLSGLLGSSLFLAGDMMFYGTLSSAADFHPLVEMAHRPLSAIVIGGLLGPIAAIFSGFGMGVFYLTTKSGSRRIALAITAALAIMMFTGGAYHAIYAVFGFASRVSDPSIRQNLIAQVASLRNAVSWPMYLAGITGTLLAYFLPFYRKTLFPRWLLILLPTTLSMADSAFRPIFLRIPAPLGSLIRGGWINGSFVLFFAAASLLFWNSPYQTITTDR